MMGFEKLDRLLEELRAVFRDAGDDPGVNRIHQAIKKEMPEIQARLHQEQKLGRILQHFREHDFAIISGFVKGVPEAENLERQFQLSQDVRKLSHGFIPIVGKWDGVPERSLSSPG